MAKQYRIHKNDVSVETRYLVHNKKESRIWGRKEYALFLTFSKASKILSEINSSKKMKTECKIEEIKK